MGMVVHSCNPSTWKAEAKGLLPDQGLPGLQGETLTLRQSKSLNLSSAQLLWPCHTSLD